MKNFLHLGMVLISVLVAQPVQAATQRQLITMNIQCYQGNWEFRLQQILNHFLSLGPDVIALQEVCTQPSTGSSQVEYIRQYLSSRGYPLQTFEAQYTHPAWNQFDEYLLVISKHRSQGVDKGFLPDSPLKRGYVGVEIDQSWYIDIHLEYREDQAHFRRQQLDFLKHRFQNRSHIILGDFNSAPESMEQGGLRDGGYFAIFPGSSHLGGDGNGSSRIDGFWFSAQARSRLENWDAKIMLNQKVQDQYLSDHFAVYLWMSLRN